MSTAAVSRPRLWLAVILALFGALGLNFSVWAATPALDDPALEEISGLVPSLQHPNVWWVHNDSGGLPTLYAIDAQGQVLGQLSLRDARNRDWEDLTALWLNGKPYLVIGDLGDNKARRKSIDLLWVEEPRVLPEAPFTLKRNVAHRMRLTYPDGPHDAEGLAYDPIDHRLLLLSKRTQPPVLYGIALDRFPQARIERIGDLPSVDFMPTAMEIDREGKTLLVLGYEKLMVARRDTRETPWPEALADSPCRLRLPILRQAEAAAFTPDGRRILVTSEGRPSPLVWFDLLEAQAAQAGSHCFGSSNPPNQ